MPAGRRRERIPRRALGVFPVHCLAMKKKLFNIVVPYRYPFFFLSEPSLTLPFFAHIHDVISADWDDPVWQAGLTNLQRSISISTIL